MRPRRVFFSENESDPLLKLINRVIIEELSVEDRLNAEVRQLLNAYEQDFERGHVDYQKMFTTVKSKLARERGIIL